MQVINRSTERIAQIGIIIGSLVLLVCGVCVTLFTIGEWRNKSRLVDAQVKVYEAQAENVGKPNIIEQRYYSPQNND